jgi:hypothetical protein
MAAERAHELSPFTRARLERIAERALAEAGVSGVLPTPLDAVQRAAGIAEQRAIGDLPPELAARDRRLLGAYWFEERVVFVDPAQAAPRRRFTEAHEAMHALCPWHRAVVRHDTEDELFRATRLAVEAEANHGAGLLIFQAGRFRARVRREPCSLASLRALAAEHGASLQATLHQYVEVHDGAVALLATGRFPRRDGALPVWTATQSPEFRRRHGAIGHHVGGCVPAGTPLRDLIEATRGGASGPAQPLDVRPGRRPALRLTAEAFYNRHAFLVLLAAPRVTGARRRLSADRRA